MTKGITVSRGSFRATVEAEHRDGKGNLISRSISIQAPNPPTCMKPGCIWRFFLRVVFCDLISRYHKMRMEYAEKNRSKKIPQKYRTGENSPSNIWQCIFAIIKLGGRQWLRLRQLPIRGYKN